MITEAMLAKSPPLRGRGRGREGRGGGGGVTKKIRVGYLASLLPEWFRGRLFDTFRLKSNNSTVLMTLIPAVTLWVIIALLYYIKEEESSNKYQHNHVLACPLLIYRQANDRAPPFRSLHYAHTNAFCPPLSRSTWSTLMCRTAASRFQL